MTTPAMREWHEATAQADADRSGWSGRDCLLLALALAPDALLRARDIRDLGVTPTRAGRGGRRDPLEVRFPIPPARDPYAPPFASGTITVHHDAWWWLEVEMRTSLSTICGRVHARSPIFHTLDETLAWLRQKASLASRWWEARRGARAPQAQGQTQEEMNQA